MTEEKQGVEFDIARGRTMDQRTYTNKDDAIFESARHIRYLQQETNKEWTSTVASLKTDEGEEKFVYSNPVSFSQGYMDALRKEGVSAPEVSAPAPHLVADGLPPGASLSAELHSHPYATTNTLVKNSADDGRSRHSTMFTVDDIRIAHTSRLEQVVVARNGAADRLVPAKGDAPAGYSGKAIFNFATPPGAAAPNFREFSGAGAWFLNNSEFSNYRRIPQDHF